MIKNLLSQKRLPSPFEMIKNYLKYNYLAIFKNKPSLPRAMCIYVTYKCNMRCKICGIWKQNSKYKKELSLEEFDTILSDPLFTKLEFININGGEPNLRQDLGELVNMFVDKFSNLKTITLNTNGIPPERTIENVNKIYELCQKNKIKFSVSISLHKIGKGYDDISGVEDSYFKVKKAFDGLKKINGNKFYMSANCVITSLNLYDLEKILEWGKIEKIPVNFTLGEIRERFHNFELKDYIVINSEKDKDYLIKFLRTLAKDKRTFFQHSLRYKQLADMIEFNKKRNLACHYAIGGVILGSEGSLYYCKNSKVLGNCIERSPYEIYFDKNNLKYRYEELIKKKCYICPPNTFNKIEVEKDLFKFIKFLFF